MQTFQVAPEDIEKGSVLAPLTFRSGRVPAGFPAAIDMRVPSQRDVMKCVEQFQRTSDPFVFLFVCLPPQWQTVDFIERLAPSCVGDLVEASYILSLGAEMAGKIF